MEQNNFEKQVQQKMEELKIHPSESAWNNIEKRIAQHTDRRKLIFILSVLIPVLLVIAFYWAYDSNETNIPEQKNKSLAIEKNKIQSNDSSLEKPDQLNKNYSETEKKIAEEKLKSFNLKKSPNYKPQKINDVTILKTKSSDADFRKEKSNKTEVENDKKIKNAEKSLEAVIMDSVIENSNTDFITESSQSKIKDENEKEESPSKKEIEKDSAIINTAKISTVKKQKSVWKSGFSFSGGTSFSGQSLFSEDKSALNYSSPGNSGGVPTTNYLPSNSTNSLAFSAGFFLQKHILNKSKISIGLNYKYFSTTNKVGSKIDSAQANYYAAYSPVNPSKNFHNKFHFLEVPVTFGLRLNPNKSLPLYWNAGISISQLISTNALQFRSDRGIYYEDNSFFNKTQIGLNTGFSATLFSKNKFPVNVGPYFYYDVTNLANKGLYNKTHFSSIGISAEVLLNKK
jgi:outer membrane biosynthesis protein TonB